MRFVIEYAKLPEGREEGPSPRNSYGGTDGRPESIRITALVANKESRVRVDEEVEEEGSEETTKFVSDRVNCRQRSHNVSCAL